MPAHDWRRVGAGIFHDFHHEWISSIKHSLNGGLLPADYYALAEPIAGGFHPDVLALSAPTNRPRWEGGNGAARHERDVGGIAVADAAPKARFTFRSERSQYAAKRKRVVIRHRAGDNVVALVEILSPGNKATSADVQRFVDKAKSFLDAGIHMLILDLFPPSRSNPQGIHAAIWAQFEEDDAFHPPKRKPLTLASYQAADGLTAYVETVAIGDPLPNMPLFFCPDRYVSVPLESSYQTAFEAVPKRWRDVVASDA